MSTTYAQKQAPAQKKDAPTASSVLDNSPQNEGLQRKADMANNAAQQIKDSICPLQKYKGKSDSTVRSKVSLIGKGTEYGKKRTRKFIMNGEGGSDGNVASRSDVQCILGDFSQRLASVQAPPQQQGQRPPNPPFQCAEPHAIADALHKLNKEYYSFIVDEISFEKARYAIPYGSHPKGSEAPPCETCRQWIDSETLTVKDEFLDVNKNQQNH